MSDTGDPSSALPQLPITHSNVPVFDCHVILSPADENGVISARVSSLDGIVAEGNVERDVLRRIVDQFKMRLQQFQQQGQPIPWREPPAVAGEGESERWIPVHL